MRTHTPPQVHLNPAWRPGIWGRGWGGPRPRRAWLPKSRRTRGYRATGSGARSGQDRYSSPSQSAPPPHHPPAPSRRLHGAAWPRGPALTAAGRMRSANAAPVGFLLNCRAVAVAAPRSAEGTRGQLERTHPAWPATLKNVPLPPTGAHLRGCTRTARSSRAGPDCT